MEAEVRRAANKTYEQEEDACQLPLLCCLLQLLQQLLLQLIIGGGCMPAAIHAASITALFKTRRRQISSLFQGVSPPSFSPSSIFGMRRPTSACRLGKLQCPPLLLQQLSLLFAHQVLPFFSSCCCCCANGLF
jgi:hypothetical protein